jgi:glycosyltransferase involved in cell wall biosynthesis
MISVVMASYLGWYKGAASNREDKFRRAVNSFLNQGIGELIIVSDGCDRTIEIAKEFDSASIQVYQIEKQPIFSGKVRQHGINNANFDWICYLDSDDEFLPGHLNAIIKEFDSADWLYYDDIVNNDIRISLIQPDKIGTSSIAHKKNINAVWPDGYGHDWNFIQQLGTNYKKISGTGYVVHHIKKQLDT